MRITFVEAASNEKLVKRFTQNKTIPYPFVSLVNSYEYEIMPSIEGMRQFDSHLRIAAQKGWAMLRGNFVRELSNESRKGHHDKTANTQRLTLDFDGVDISNTGTLDCDSKGVRRVCEYLLKQLGPDFADVSYVAEASSSFGRSGDRASLHIELFLDEEVNPKQVKRYLQHLNFECPLLADQLELSSNAVALKWPLDISVADNSKLIFVAAPVFDGVANPFDNDDERIILVEKDHPCFSSAVIKNVAQTEVDKKHNEVIKGLRKELKLSNKAPRTRIASIGDEMMEVLSNPDEMMIEIASDDGEYIRANINGGDSAGYWWPKTNPEYVFNFKGEPIFRMKDASAGFYHNYRDTYRDAILQAKGLEKGYEPVCFRDPMSDIYYSMIVNESEDVISQFAAINQASIDNFMRNNGMDRPDVLPEYTVVFDPTTNSQFNPAEGWVNKFRPTKYLLATDALEDAPVTTYGTAGDVIKKYAPDFYKHMRHVLGNQEAELEHYVNWLAYAVQRREKTGTAWIFLGTPGTGKSLLFNTFFKPVFGEYAKQAKTDNIDDDKNGFLEDALFVFIDEFKEQDARSTSRMHNVIKNMITETHMSIRKMRQEARTVRNYTNFLFTTNDMDVVSITEDDRRFNICTKQQFKLLETHPDLIDGLYKEDQLLDFCRILNNHQIDESKVRELIKNKWRDTVRISSMNAFQQFLHAVERGDLDYFVDAILYDKGANADENRNIAARDIVLKWIENLGDVQYVEIADLRAVYNTMAVRSMDTHKFKAAILKHGFEEVRARLANTTRRPRALRVGWKVTQLMRGGILSEFQTPVNQFLNKMTEKKQPWNGATQNGQSI